MICASLFSLLKLNSLAFRIISGNLYFTILWIDCDFLTNLVIIFEPPNMNNYNNITIIHISVNYNYAQNVIFV